MARMILDFEAPIKELYDKIEELKNISSSSESNGDLQKDIENLKAKAAKLKEKVYAHLEPIHIVKIARHPERPTSLEYIEHVFTDFIELHGDRLYGDDHAIVGGFARIDGEPIMLITQQKGRSTKENLYRNFGMAQPEGYRKALRLMRLADKFKLPIVTLIDTNGAYPGMGSEERGVAEAIAKNLQEMMGFTVPIISVVIGEGGSGGALGIAVGNTVAMLQYAIYSVITPEGCAAILWRDASQSRQAAENLGLTSQRLKEMEVIDTIIDEPLEGAHSDPKKCFRKVKSFLKKELKKLKAMDVDKLLESRYQRFRKLGKFQEPASVSAES